MARHGVFQFGALHHTWVWLWLERRGHTLPKMSVLGNGVHKNHVHGEDEVLNHE